MNTTLTIEHLDASIEDKQILQNFNLKIQSGEVHVIMGPNGSGKSTLSKILAGHPSYEVNNGIKIDDFNEGKFPRKLYKVILKKL